ncbi:pheromone A receptor-domain-containing protein [Hypoxylon sp. FL0890]|nr:pheromone A receptor-domain-containing protein [Hypoxylon sp. FL0890]
MSPIFFKLAIAAAIAAAVVAATDPQDDSTSPDRRYAPNPSLQANAAFRVIFAIIGTALCLVPFRLLWRNADFAAVVLIVDVALMNFFTVLNSLIWHSDNWDNWWSGKGLCDIEVYLSTPLETIYAAAIFAIIRQLARQVKLARMSELNRKERTRRMLIQAAIIFPIPLFQLLFTWFDLAHRYFIGTVVGCMVVLDNSWPTFVVYDAPSPLYVVASVPFAFLTWKRYRAISKTTREALKSNSVASARANRTRFRLYNMSMSIIIIYLPVSIYLFVYSIQESVRATYLPYSYKRIHFEATPYPWNAILYVPSWMISSAVMNQPWISIATTVAIVAFFGTTKDGLAMYRQYAMTLGLGRCFRKVQKPHATRNGRSRVATPEEEQGTWIELIHKPDKDKGKAVANHRFRRADPYFIPLESPTDTDPHSTVPTDKPHSPLSPLPEPLSRPHITPPPVRLPFPPISHKMSSPLDRLPIDALIPPRSSSMQNLHASALEAPAAKLPRLSIAKCPVLHSGEPHRSYTAEVEEAGPLQYLTRTQTRPRGNSNRSDTIPILSPPSLDPIADRLDRVEDSPETSLRGQSSRDVVQNREMIRREDWNTPYTTDTVNWPFCPGTALTSSTASLVRPGEPVNGVLCHESLVRPVDDGFEKVPTTGAEAWQRSEMETPGATRVRRKIMSRSLVPRSAPTVSPDTTEKPAEDTK